ncbi:MAG: peptide deformylase [Clostridiales bacterium]|nr:peptide deformylase [Bacillota bacterium]MEE0517398.1 peptide deformylase [Anaerovoracaceae bacterium]PWL94535.1 MAG: peptide deformylase [Clostridiales bacterium]
MALRNIVTEGDEILRKKCREVSEVTDRIKETMSDMLETMRNHMGVGIAGPQVGVMRRMFVAEPEPGRVYYMINPVITEKSGSQIADEGCLSVPGMIGEVERPDYIKIEALDLEGNKQVYEFRDFDARVMCHEYDHLDGILYVDKAKNVRDAFEDEYGEEEE